MSPISEQILLPLLSKFINAEKVVHKDQLREFVGDQFKKELAWAMFLLKSPDYHPRWMEIKNYFASRPDDTERLAAWEQLLNLDMDIQQWIDDHVDSSERMEFSIQSKAHEIHSGDENYDYFTALLIRHDQLLAAVVVFQDVLGDLAKLTELDSVNDCLESSLIGSLMEKSVEEKIFETAEIMFDLRNKG